MRSLCTSIPAAALPLLVLLIGSCSSPDGPGEATPDGPPRTPSIEAALAESARWVDYHEPDASSDGYTLALYQRRVPFLMDMNGRAVHTWPHVRASARAVLLPSGHLAVLGETGRLEEYDWDGRQTWSFTLPGDVDMLHHDFARLRNGNYLLLALRRDEKADYLLEVDRSGREVWRWSSYEAMPDELQRGPGSDRTHMNSVQELPPNKWFERGLEAFRPGNILASARNLNALYIVARPSGDVVWTHGEGLDWQHEARMIPAGIPGEGHILVFDNGYHGARELRQSSVLEIDPVERSEVWSWRSPGFFSATGGAQQVLPNGNLLVTSSRGGRAFELTKQGRIVWHWVPPYLPMRVSRYPRDHCPQLAALDPPSKRPVRKRDPERFIDADLYAFALTHGVRRVKEKGVVVEVLRRPDDCQRLLLPDAPHLTVRYGIVHGGRCEEAGGGQVRFAVSIRPAGAEVAEDLLVRAVGAEDFDVLAEGPATLREEVVSLARFERQRVEMCLSVESFGARPAPECFVWGAPTVHPGAPTPEESFEEEQTPEVLEHQRRQLEALGYVN